MQLDPLANRVICKAISEDRELKSGLVIPDIAVKHKGIQYGEVIAVGPGRLNAEGKHVPVHVAVGDVVMFPRQAPAVIPLEDENGNETEVLMLPENDIIAKVHGLKRASSIVGLNGAPLSLVPQSLALPDQVYASREGVDRAISDLRQVNAPPDVIAEIASEQRDQHESEVDAVEQ